MAREIDDPSVPLDIRFPPHPPLAPRWLRATVLLCLLAGLWRAGSVYLHEPLVALANSYDEVRYSACFDLYPDRPIEILPTENSPQAPYSHYVFLPRASPICYWSTELIFLGVAAETYLLQAKITNHAYFPMRWPGALKLAALLALWWAFVRASLRRGRWTMALAHALALPLLLTDPANTIYLNTFYAEWTALLCCYATLGLATLYDGEPWRGGAFALLALAAAALAISKIQHIVLPLGLAAVVLALGRWRDRRWPWQGWALLLGAAFGLLVQGVQLQRDNAVIRDVALYNNADVAFTALLPYSRDPAATAERLGLSPSCLQYSGLRAWQMPGFPGDLCPELRDMSRARQLAVLLHEPGMALRLLRQGLENLHPWIAPGLGLVEGGFNAPLPSGLWSWSAAFDGSRLCRTVLFVAPFATLIALSRRGRRYPRLLLFTALCCVVMLGTLTVTVLGDGLADVPKQCHLVYAAALAWWIVALTGGIGAIYRLDASSDASGPRYP